MTDLDTSALKQPVILLFLQIVIILHLIYNFFL